MDAIREILLHLDGGRHAAARLHLARALAARHGAHLSAQASVLPVPMELAELHAQRAHALVDAANAGGGWPVEWAAPTLEQPIPAFARLALHADLLVLGQHDLRDEEASTMPFDFVEAVLLSSGRPALVVPHHPHARALGFDHVLVAWQPKPESAHALSAALPLLQRAREVALVCWDEDRDAAAGQLQQVARHLRLHGVQPARLDTGLLPPDAGEALLGHARDVGADLLVMGCYGHSRAREFVLGGATHGVLRDMHLPVLMAH